MGFLTLILIIMDNTPEKKKLSEITYKYSVGLNKLGFVIGIITLIIEWVLLTLAQLASFRVLKIGNSEHWRYWPYTSYISLLVLGIISLIFLFISAFIYEFMDIFHNNFPIKTRHYKKIAILLPIIVIFHFFFITIVFPVIKFYAYLQGTYLLGKPTIQYTPVEHYYLLEHSLLFNQPSVNYFQTYKTPKLLYNILGLSALLFISFGIIICILFLFGLVLESDIFKGISNQRKISYKIRNISLTLGILSIFLEWFILIILISWSNRLNWYDVFIDLKGFLLNVLVIIILILGLCQNRIFAPINQNLKLN
jgi:hypothetical protein